MDQAKELLEMPRAFLKDGRQFITRCSKPDRREFLRIGQAVGMGFLIMGVIGYVVKLSESLPRYPLPRRAERRTWYGTKERSEGGRQSLCGWRGRWRQQRSRDGDEHGPVDID
ncbi:hypothetical protein LTR35_016551 [Friedmanniomyces endolithicus]|uniref:Protein transport protein Sec61 subunit gamma n=1 Tax=Friedmanniomyces endolithicus TaxID=329885 RepID=A0AAN6F8P1_9PEZI|nr:hypothetical protein LTR35_016551 [Friedmanniomyces endolithicus]KAK0273823.1 hypothetical protein LTS00_015673 [Friedmanniomyces endolithicus]KAK0306221.1 hypothetical protein LTR82_016436 [Friedmanniomyces endolithicus]KAK0978034.1 hypothetical protein LTR54_016059 [Friedmanniomyces endolithicus]